MEAITKAAALFDEFKPENLTVNYSWNIDKQEYNFRLTAKKITVNGVEYSSLDCSLNRAAWSDSKYSRVTASRWHNNKFHCLSPAAQKKLTEAYDKWLRSVLLDEKLLLEIRKEAHRYRIERQREQIAQLEEQLKEANETLVKFQNANCFPFKT